MKIALNKKLFSWINFIWFQVIWFVAVFYTEQTMTLLLISLCLHFLLTPTREADLLTMLGITLLGSLGDFLLTFLGIYIFPETLFIPVWLILLWAHFALALNHGMSWLSNLPGYGRILFGAIFGTLSYYAGAQFGAVTLHQNLTLSLFSMAVIWATLLPVYIEIALFNRVFCDENINQNVSDNLQ
ncbi:membrane protein [Psychromonas marina]|uniref:Membrane protein n=1 Tax=Psychromonas marina TaxID=88364 RepID=A0ABQ6E3B2_9GAMM|nr:DUF2878 domain-containing protein [Psychromonas marina]GLS91927.1 membrane protein [Psychromonas marina]